MTRFPDTTYGETSAQQVRSDRRIADLIEDIWHDWHHDPKFRAEWLRYEVANRLAAERYATQACIDKRLGDGVCLCGTRSQAA